MSERAAGVGVNCPVLKSDRDAILADLARAYYRADCVARDLKGPTLDELQAADRVARSKHNELWNALAAEANNG